MAQKASASGANAAEPQKGEVDLDERVGADVEADVGTSWVEGGTVFPGSGVAVVGAVGYGVGVWVSQMNS